MEIKFKRDTSFRKQFFTPGSFAHPAKMDAQLLLWIVERYSTDGETILDPMAGSGTTMLACTLGRHCILVELEEKFCKMMRDNWEVVKMRPQLGSIMGDCQIIQGDARQLEGLLVDKCIFSPPFAEAHNAKGLGVGDNDRADLRPYSYLKTGTKGQIGDLPYKLVDKIVTSPPFSEAKFDKRHGLKDLTTKGMKGRKAWANREDNNPTNPDNIANLPYGEIDKCIFSPPYAEAQSGGGIAQKGYQGDKHSPTDLIGKRSYMPGNIGDQDNISNLPYGQIDKIVTSPPYEGATTFHDFDFMNKTAQDQRERRMKGLIKGHNFTAEARQRAMQKAESGVVENEQNIGNLKSQSYLEAMLQVYQQCHKVLKPEGLMILVTKNFIRNKQVVRLDEDTIKLCEQVGFSFVERHYRELPSQSFWRIIYHQKYPGVEKIEHEDVLVFRK